MKIHIKLNERIIVATMLTEETALAFVALLPISIVLHDIFKREKFGALPKSIGKAKIRSINCSIGDLVYWEGGPNIGIIYADDGIPMMGKVQLLGYLEECGNAFAESGPLEVTIFLPDCAT